MKIIQILLNVEIKIQKIYFFLQITQKIKIVKVMKEKIYLL